MRSLSCGEEERTWPKDEKLRYPLKHLNTRWEERMFSLVNPSNPLPLNAITSVIDSAVIYGEEVNLKV